MNLYWRLLLVLLGSKPRLRAITDAGRVRLRVWPHDCDLNFHMNNGRYLTFMDLGRLHLLASLGLLLPLVRRRWMPVLGAAEMSFVRPLDPWQKFDLVTRLLGWDAKYFYLEQRFEIEARLCALGTVRGLFVSQRERVPSQAVADLWQPGLVSPPLPPRIHQWNALLEAKKATV